MKPTAHDSRINIIGPVKVQEIRISRKGNQLHQEISPTKGKKQIKFKKQSKKYTDV